MGKLSLVALLSVFMFTVTASAQILCDDGSLRSSNCNLTEDAVAVDLYARNNVFAVEPLPFTDTNTLISSFLPGSGCFKEAGSSLGIEALPVIGGIINYYTPVLGFDPCKNQVNVEDAAGFGVGDTVLIIQMKGAVIDGSNTAGFGNILDYRNAGHYEFNYIRSITGNVVELENILQGQYDIPAGKAQLIRVPSYKSVVVGGTLTCPDWDGNKGGVLVLNVQDTVELQAAINVSGKGFRGGAVGGGFSCGNMAAWAAPVGTGGTKGEGIADFIVQKEAGGAALANGGGGAYAANSGGGGGGNAGAGGVGGFHSNTCPQPTQSINGGALDYTPGNRIFLGGGGGGGQQDNNQPVAPGGNGGGIVIIKADRLNCNNQQIIANGASVTTLVRDEGGGGGGAGGSVLLFVNNYSGNLSIEAKGGDGSSNDNQIYPSRCHGPGGGGGGGWIGISSPSLPGFINANLAAGRAGVVLNPSSACFNTTNGAGSGFDGSVLNNLLLPISTVPFKKNIDSVKITEVQSGCREFQFNGWAYTNTSSIAQWRWDFGDGNFAAQQNASHSYTGHGSHTVTLLATDANGCRDSVVKIINSSGLNFDFVQDQDICMLRNVQFTAVGDKGSNIYWSMGDGTVFSNVGNPLHQFADTGSYTIQYSTYNSGASCVDTIRKMIHLTVANENIVLTPDTTICFGADKLLRSAIDSTLPFCWDPVGFLNNSNVSNPTTRTPSSLTYSLTAAVAGINLVVNGDFDAGNTGFQTGLVYNGNFNTAADTLDAGEYTVSAAQWSGGTESGCADRKNDASGKMLIARTMTNGAVVWSQQIPVTPHTNYSFRFWLSEARGAGRTVNNVKLAILVNGNTIDSITPASTECSWKSYRATWNSGNNSSALFSIRDISVAPLTTAGKYFLIDDISLAASVVKRDTVRIAVDTPFVHVTPDTSTCEGASVQLNATGSVRYTWVPAASLSNAASANPVATPTDTTKYIVSGTNSFGCTALDSLTVFVKPAPVITNTGDTTICFNGTAQLYATGGVDYLWQPSGLLNSAVIDAPVTTALTANSQYRVTVTGSNGCTATDSFTVTVKPLPAFSVSPPQSTCLYREAQLSASGGDQYLWSPAALVSNPAVSNPRVPGVNTTIYSVWIRDTLCGFDSILTTTVKVLPLPVVAVAKSNDISCTLGSTQLRAAGAEQYAWLPAASLNNTAIPDPVARPRVTTTYTVTGTDSSGCTNTATVTVFADYSGGAPFAMPNAFSPNADGKNDCFRIKYFGAVSEFEMRIYDRWGNRIFDAVSPDDCWDGTYKGRPCSPGNFTYHLRAKTACGSIEKKGSIVLIR